MTKEFKITKERVLAMADECPQAEGILKKGFPEAFKENEVITEDFKEAVVDILKDLEGLVNESDGCADMIKRAEWIVGKFLYCHVPGETLQDIQEKLVKKYKDIPTHGEL